VSGRTGRAFPTGILAVNLFGAFFAGALNATAFDNEAITVFASAIGSFSTFSAWMFETQRLIAGKRADLACLNIAISLIVGFSMVALGYSMGGL